MEIGFPLGATTTEVKVFEAEQALKYGATEVDMVINIGALKDGQDTLVKADIARVSQVVHNNGGLCKVIPERVFRLWRRLMLSSRFPVIRFESVFWTVGAEK